MPDETEPLCLIWSFEHSAWWGPRRLGYVLTVEEAGEYRLSEALHICRNANIPAINEAIVVVDGQRYPADLPTGYGRR